MICPQVLLEFGCDVDHVDACGRSALLAAASCGHACVVRRLLFWGCYTDHIDADGRSVLSVAAARGCVLSPLCLFIFVSL